MNNKKLTSALACFLISGCAGVAPESLTRVSVVTSIDLKDPFVYEIRRVVGNQEVITVGSGTYTAILEDTDGTLYYGPPKCFVITTPSNPGWAFGNDCGIYLPKNTNLPAKIYVVTNSGGVLPPREQKETTNPPRSQGPEVAVVQIGSTVQSATPTQAGIGAGIGAGIVVGLSELESGRFKILDGPYDGIAFRAKLSLRRQ